MDSRTGGQLGDRLMVCPIRVAGRGRGREEPLCYNDRMRFSLRTIFLLTLGAAILLAAPWPASWTPVLAALGIGIPLTFVAILNVAFVGAFMGILAAVDWLIRKLGRRQSAKPKN